MARNPTSFRLCSEALAALELLCVEQGRSRTDVLEWMLLGQSSSKQRRSLPIQKPRPNVGHRAIADTIVLTRAAHALIVSEETNADTYRLAQTLLSHAVTLIKHHTKQRTGAETVVLPLDPYVSSPPRAPHPRHIATIIERITNNDHT